MGDSLNNQVDDISATQILCVFVNWVWILMWADVTSILQVLPKGNSLMARTCAIPFQLFPDFGLKTQSWIGIKGFISDI